MPHSASLAADLSAQAELLEASARRERERLLDELVDDAEKCALSAATIPVQPS